MTYKTILYTDHSHWAEIQLNRPEVYNAITPLMLEELLDAFGKAERKEPIKCVVLTGHGKVFCSGQDLKSVGTDIDAIPFRNIITEYYNPLIMRIRTLKKPVIGKIEGLAVGAGASLALACDILLMSKEAYIAQLFAQIGLVMDAGANYFLTKKVGRAMAFELATTGRKVYGEEALALGLVNKVVEEGEMDQALQFYLDIYKGTSSHSIGLIKNMLNRAGEMKLEEVLEMEANCQEKAGRHPDFKEGLSAFLEKRRPNFK
ncbi:2-(1,2-epoxy-1,2-dihydrophenyl)acetyl-CoA isomerase [Echinicola pacifica]|uniref:2-(1,2-epoxy-1,2-dihydrophenyl)acetyl-CoA isomerase n=1 Tax=Echinicola pacifica TaxID=346377 RepID=A0A918QC64_9BACT|nr:enoyl-CoA hydratase-related protein [Echinicola pacifica]GGZ40446.1 2-(1,2-epoxy-1,2-dihydrophenyl)acetyl-CoA isomerase [Echinicola pacifica]